MNRIYAKANILYVPALLIVLVFVIYPFFDGIRIAFTNWNGFSRTYSYVGFLNFRRIFTDGNVLGAARNTLIYGFGSTIIQQILGLGAALLLNKAFFGRGIARTILYIPVMISAVVMGYMWRYLTQFEGALNDILILFGNEPILWLSSANLAISLMVIINSMQYFGISMIIYLAGLQSIPQMYYENAALAGAGRVKTFFYITVPLLYPAFSVSILLNLIGGLQLFDVIRALTGGGPGFSTHSLGTLINTTYFAQQNAGYSAVIGLFLFILILLITIIFQVIFSKREVDF